MSSNWTFGLLRSARDGQPASILAEAAAERDLRATDRIGTLKGEQFTVERRPFGETSHNVVFWGELPLRPRAMQALALQIGVPQSIFQAVDPDIVQTIIHRHLPPAERKVRLFKTESEVCVRGIVSPRYQPIPAADQVEALWSSISMTDSLRVTGLSSTPENFSADVIDLTTEFDVNKLGDPGPVPNDVLFAGWRFDTDDTGGGGATIASYLWRLICNNGSSVVDRETMLRAIHKGLATFKGRLMTREDWLEPIIAAKAERLQLEPTADLLKRVAKQTNRPGLAVLKSVFDSLTAPDTTVNDSAAVDALLSSVFSTAPASASAPVVSRWDLAQATGKTGNLFPADRQLLQDLSGALLTRPLAESFPTLEPLLVGA